LLEATTAAQALRMASQYAPDLVLLDLGLPDREGVEVARGIRAWSALPIIVLSARAEESVKVALLDAGADDYLTNPFGFHELLARMRATLRRSQRPETSIESVFTCGPLSIDLPARRVHLDGDELHLTPIEYKLLTLLARHAGKVVTKKQLLVEVWGPRSSEEHQYLRVYMTHLRRKLKGASGILRTQAGVGYWIERPEAAQRDGHLDRRLHRVPSHMPESISYTCPPDTGVGPAGSTTTRLGA
jgi:two-component system KDP operon response regulator KdpE